jgi:hypothetical protein
MQKYEENINEHIPFKFKASSSVVDILRSTKTIIQNSETYHSYMTKHKSTLDSQIEPKSHRTQSFSKSPYKLTFYNSVKDFTKKELDSPLGESKYYPSNPINLFNTQAEIFYDISYFDKEYDYSKIYRKDNYYLDMIKKKVEYFKNNSNLNHTTVLNKTFRKFQGNTNIEITFNSLEIRFINTNDLISRHISFYLPFALLPIYYFVDIETFKLLLMSILKFKNDSYTDVFIQDDLISEILSTWSEYDTDKYIEFNNSNINKFNWLTSRCIYDVYIKNPRIKFKLGDETISKFIDHDLIFYLYDKNFLNWDFYLANYLISFKDIRKTIDTKLSRPKEARYKSVTEKEPTPVVYSKYYSERDKCYSFVLTHTDKTNTLYKIAPSKLYVNIPHLGVERWFEFNLKQMKIIYSLSDDQKEIEAFFRKLLFLNKNGKIILDIEKLENVTPMLFKCMQKYTQNMQDKKTNWIINFM